MDRVNKSIERIQAYAGTLPSPMCVCVGGGVSLGIAVSRYRCDDVCMCVSVSLTASCCAQVSHCTHCVCVCV